jgi:hypothetical protein
LSDSPSLSRRRLLAAGTSLAATASPAFAQGGVEVFEVSDHQTATIDGRQWDKPIAGGKTFDAVHRSVLLRFPTAANDIANLLRQGRVLIKAELSLRYGGYEIVPDGYTCRDGLGRKMWTDDPPTWHVQAWPLRQPWMADASSGPTFNASINGRRYWGRYGASDPARDRLVGLLEPQELSRQALEARFDISRLLSSAIIERDAGARLRWLEQCGFLLRKVETYDSRYRQRDAYEWAMPIGGHGLRFAAARIVVELRRVGTTGSVSVALPLAVERDPQFAKPDGSRPTAVLPTPEQVAERARRALHVRDTGRPAWQLAHIKELSRVGGDSVSRWADVEGENGYRDYQGRLRDILVIPPRYWLGWEIQDNLLVWHLFRDLLPAPVEDHMKGYWEAWLQPDLPTSAFVHPQSPDAIDYWKRNHDWRGRASFFRDGYNYGVSTQNFNHTAAMGALLGGAMIDSAHAMGDGHHGLETLPLRFWGFLDGSTQEMLDHYYLSITLSAQKMFADFAPTAIDRLMGRILVDRTMEMLTSVYHPRLRRFVSSSTRARMSGVLIEQDGIYGALHTVSKAGAVKYLDQPLPATVHGMPAWGYDFPPGRVAMQSLPSPWAPDWLAGLIDDKPVPFEETATETTRNNFKPPLWRRSYLGRWYGLASADIRGGSVDIMAQWARAPQTSTRLDDLGTLTARYVANGPDLATTREGGADVAGLLLTYQSRNRAIVFGKPHNNRDRLIDGIGKDGTITRLATVIGLWNFAAKRDWEILVDGQKIDRFPHRLGANQRILIRDGITYLAILPLPASNLGRDAEIEIGLGVGGHAEIHKEDIAPALTISFFNFKRDQPVSIRDLDTRVIMTRTHSGFVLEMGDAEQHGSFEAFVRHMAANQLTANWREDRRLLEVAYRSGNDLMEVGFTTDFSQPSERHYVVNPGQQEKAIPYRRLNGQWPYLPPGIDRDTTWAQQGTTGRLEKNGSALNTTAGRKAYLLADPKSGAVVGYNPLPDPQNWTLQTHDGLTIRADGWVSLLRVEYRPWLREIDIVHTPKPDQNSPNMAKTFSFTGLAEPPRVTLNGQPAEVRQAGQVFQITL